MSARSDDFKCGACGGVFEKAWSDKEAVAESEAKFQMPVTEETHVLICDDCFKRIFDQ